MVTFARCTADFASQILLLQSTATVEQVTAVGAEDQRANGRHARRCEIQVKGIY